MKHTDTITEVQVRISLEKVGALYRLCYFEDSNKEITKETLTEASGLGVKLIQLSAKQLNAMLNISTDNGIKYTIEFEDE